MNNEEPKRFGFTGRRGAVISVPNQVEIYGISLKGSEPEKRLSFEFCWNYCTYYIRRRGHLICVP